MTRPDTSKKGADSPPPLCKPLKLSSLSLDSPLYNALPIDSKLKRPYIRVVMDRQQRQNGPIKERQKMQTLPGENLLTLKELAQRLRLHPDTARSLYRRGKIPGIKLGHRTLRFDYAQVLEALRQAGDSAVANTN
jgi:excisionase family DNA binding protein